MELQDLTSESRLWLGIILLLGISEVRNCCGLENWVGERYSLSTARLHDPRTVALYLHLLLTTFSHAMSPRQSKTNEVASYTLSFELYAKDRW